MINHDNSFLSSHVQKLLKRIKFDSNLFKYSSKCFIIKNNLIFLDFNYLNKERISNSILFNDDNSILEDDFDNDEERMFIKASKNIQFISRCVEFYFKNVSRINNIYQYESNETYINDDYVYTFDFFFIYTIFNRFIIYRTFFFYLISFIQIQCYYLYYYVQN